MIILTFHGNNNEIQSKKPKRKGKKSHLMHTELIQLYSGVIEENEQNLKDDENFQGLLMMYKRRHQILLNI